MKVKQCHVHLGFFNKCWTMTRRPVKELARPHRSGALLQRHTDLIYHNTTIFPLQMVGCRRIKLCCRCKAWSGRVHVILIPYCVCTCSRVSANNSGCGFYFSKSKNYISVKMWKFVCNNLMLSCNPGCYIGNFLKILLISPNHLSIIIYGTNHICFCTFNHLKASGWWKVWY